MLKAISNTARKVGPERPSFKLSYDPECVDFEDPRTQLFALYGNTENAPFRICLHDQSEGRDSEYALHSLSSVKETALKMLERQDYEVYLSAAMFPPCNGRRVKVRISGVPAVMLDVDFHKTDEYANSSPEEMVSTIFRLCNEFNIPCPDMIIHSGGGLQLYWIFEPLIFSKRFVKTDDTRSQREINCDRWMSIVRQLWSVFAPLGADPRGNNVVRLMRLVGSKSQRNNKTVRIVHLAPHLMQPGADRGTFFELEMKVRYGIEENFDKIDHEGNEERKRGEKKTKVPKVVEVEVSHDPKAPQRINEAFEAPNNVINLQSVREHQQCCHKSLHDFGYGTQAQYRLSDIFKIIEGRHDNKIPKGFRNSYIYVIGSLLAFLAPPAALEHRTHQLARKLCDHNWTLEETKNSISSVLDRAKEAEKGKKRHLNGKLVDPRYWYNSDNLAEFLNVNLEEMQAYDLRAVINETRRRENYLESQKKYNESRPETPEQRRKNELILKIQKMYEEGMGKKQIVRETGKALNTVRRYISMPTPVIEEIQEPEFEEEAKTGPKKPRNALQKPVRKIKSPILAKTKKANRMDVWGLMAANDSGPDVIEFRKPTQKQAEDYPNSNATFGSPMEKLAVTGCPF